MYHKSVSILLLLLGLITSSYGDEKFDVKAIPAHLMERADATVREETIHVHMKNPGNVTIHIARTVTVHNKNGEEHAAVRLYYNKARKIRRVKGQILDEHGRSLARFSLKDFTDRSASGQNDLYDDTRIKTYHPTLHHYPYTITYDVEIRENQNLLLPRWIPDYYYDVSVQKSSYTMTMPESEGLRIHENNYPGQVVQTADGKTKTYQWNVSDVAAKRFEAFSPPRELEATSVRLVPENFQYYRKKGTFKDWNGYGKWMYDQLLADKRGLPQATVDHVKTLTAEAKTPQEKAKILYRYLQEKTRYISIQIGIGGFEPFSAASVDRLGYGDCKALVIYMQSLLDIVDIPSYYCIVEAGSFKRDLTVDFANVSDGNHVILCIPFENDTTWLECTSQHLPYGFLGDFTDDRVVVACTEEGGKLMRTPKYDDAANLQMRQAHFTIAEDGSLDGSMETVFKGNRLDDHYYNSFENQQDQRRNLTLWYDINQISFNRITYDLQQDDSLALTESVGVNIRDYVVKAGDYVILQPNIFNVSNAIPATRNRSNSVYINRGFTDVDVITYVLPAGYDPNIVPTDKQLETPMASYELKTTVVDGILTTFRRFQLREGNYSPGDYREFHGFMTEVRSTDLGKYRIALR